MPLGLGPRFVVEAAFLVAVAVAAGMLALETPVIVAVMAGAWLLVAVLEWTLSRRTSTRRPEPVLVADGARAAAHEPDRMGVARTPAAREPGVEPEPLPEPVAPEPVEATPAPDPLEALPEGVPPPFAEPLPPAAEPLEEPSEPEQEPEPARAPQPEPEPEREPDRAEVARVERLAEEPREWNVWDLERAAKDAAGDDVERDQERAFLLMYLRDFAGPDGSLPSTFDALVRDSFGDVAESSAR